MLPADHRGIRLGPLFRTIADRAKWRDDPSEECFPSRQYIADEFERYLAFAEAQGQLARFLPRLRDHRRRRDAAFNEIAVAFMFQRDGFPVVEWEPPGYAQSGSITDAKLGEFAIKSNESRIFVEVKSPDWEGELEEAERADRKRQPKHQHLEARAINNIPAIRHAVGQAAAKFTGDEPSLLVIVDDFFLSLEHQTWGCEVALYCPQEPGWSEGGYLATDGPFATATFANVGGVMIFWQDRNESREFDQVAFGRRLYLNPNAAAFARLPDGFIAAYRGVDRPEYR